MIYPYANSTTVNNISIIIQYSAGLTTFIIQPSRLNTFQASKAALSICTKAVKSRLSDLASLLMIEAVDLDTMPIHH
jgi:hypothetical protein